MTKIGFYRNKRAITNSSMLVILLFTASSDGVARLWSVDTGEVKREYSGHQKAVICLAFRDEIPAS